MTDGQDKVLHPFFTKPHVPPPKLLSDLDTQPPIEDTIAGAHESLPEQPDAAPPQSSHGRKAGTKQPKANSEAHTPLESVDMNTTRRSKRRKLSPKDETCTGNQGSEDMPPLPSSPTSLPSSHPDTSQHNVTHDPTQKERSAIPQAKDVPSSTPPRKMVGLKPGGTLISPSSKSRRIEEEAPVKRSTKRGRPKKERSRLVVLRYSSIHAMGDRITRILDGTERFAHPKPAPMAPPPKPKAAKPDPSKPTHPFFSGKPKDSGNKSRNLSKDLPEAKSASIAQSPRRTSAVTPGKLRAQACADGIRDADDSANLPQFGTNRDKHIVKQPGMVEAPFPPKGLAHVRGQFYYHVNHPKVSTPPVVLHSLRKMKHAVPLLDPSESVLHKVTRNLDYTQKDTPRQDGFFEPPTSLRVPSKHLIPGTQVRTWISNELHSVPSANYHQSKSGPAQMSAHPACEKLFENISNTLTPFDEGKSEIQTWAHKYSPRSASQVLQFGREATYLRDWMKALTINAVESSNSQASRPDRADRERKPKKKRRKKMAELDDFIVNDEAVFNDVEEPVELERAPGHSDQAKLSFAHDYDLNDPVNRSKITNSIIISGPPGCGKTALVNAVAKELGFEIFEINPGSRRSGKDVLDRIGDMVENHLVQNRSADAGNTSADEDAGRLSDAFNKDLESGRQGTMMSFFSSKPTGVSKPKQPKPKEKETKPKMDINQVQKVLSSAKPSRGQKQSIILLEEVDIMFEEDKNFWPTIFTLLKTSKRPVIMTCNDEDLVPVQAIQYQALLRLSAPPPETAVDYLLLMAAQEGHLLHREAVSTLYHAKHFDLRASIAELQLWCQMGVGDPRGGLSWIYQRWPAGSGVDVNNQAKRVISENTYQPGMGFLAHEKDFSIHDSQDEELLKESWETWDIDPRETLFSASESGSLMMQRHEEAGSQRGALKQWSAFADSLSDMDVFCRVGLPGRDNYLVDATQPALPDKTRMSYIDGMKLLQAPQVVDYSTLDTQLAVSCSRLASKAFSIPLHSSHSDLVKQASEAQSPNHPKEQLTRNNMSSAFDIIATVMTTVGTGPPTLLYSILDGPFRAIVTDVAPYIRSIAAYDLALEAHRSKLHGSSQGSTGGSVAGSKRARTTRAARSALEGGQRQLTRRERWFDPGFEPEAALRTAGKWPRVEDAIAEARVNSAGFEMMMVD